MRQQISKIEIAFSKTSIILSIVLASLFIYLGTEIFLNGDHYKTYIFYNKYLIAFIFPLTCFFSLIAIGFLLFKLFSSRRGLIINDNGIIDNSAAVDFGLIIWKDITKIEVKEIMSKKIIIIYVADSSVYLSRVKNPIFLFFLKKRINNYHYLITISSQLLLIDIEDLFKLLTESLKNYRHND